jgi:hypothetical protein
MIIAAGLMMSPATTAAGAAAEPGTSTAPAPDVTVTGKRPDRDKMVCKSDVTTGSIIPVQTCKTKGEWEEIRQRNLATVQRLKEDRTREQHVRDSVDNR